MKILIVEDDPITAEAVSLTFELRWQECEVVSTAYGAEGVRMIETEIPDIVILDLGLPDMDGLQVLFRIRTLSNVPVIILSARDDQATIVKGLEIGADDYITKPFEPTELLSHAKVVLQRTSIPQPSYDQ